MSQRGDVGQKAMPKMSTTSGANCMPHAMSQPDESVRCVSALIAPPAQHDPTLSMIGYTAKKKPRYAGDTFWPLTGAFL